MTLPSSNAQFRLAIKLFTIFLCAVLAFGGIYFGLSHIEGHGIKPKADADSFLNCVYFSVVTITTVGYGDILPSRCSRLVACIEAVFGIAFAGYAISQIVSAKQEALIDYLAKDRIIQTYNQCLEMVKEAKELIGDKRRLIQAKAPIDSVEYIYNRSNPFYPALRSVEMLNGYTDHIQNIGEAKAMSDRIERAAHHVEELAGFTRKLVNLLVSHKAVWRTKRTILILNTLCDALDTFTLSYIVHTRYDRDQYKGGGMYKEIIQNHTAHIRTNLQAVR